MAIELLVILVGVIVVGAAGFFLLRGLSRKHARDKTNEGDSPLHEAELEPPGGPNDEERRQRREERRERREERRQRREERRQREAEGYANPLTDHNAWNLDDANGDNAELQYRGVDPEDC